MSAFSLGAYAGLFSFESSEPAAAEAAPDTGEVVLRGNSFRAVVVTVDVPGFGDANLTAQSTFHCNLEPVAIADVDVGAAQGAAMPDRNVGDAFTTPLRVRNLLLWLVMKLTKRMQFLGTTSTQK